MPHSRLLLSCALLGTMLVAGPALSAPAVTSEAAWKTSFDSGVKARKAEKYADAERVFRRAVTEAEAFGSQDDRLVRSLNELGTVLRLENKIDEARPVHERALRIAEVAHGKESPDVATSIYGLAAIANLQGRAADAEPLFQRALAIREKCLGPNSPEVAHCLYGYANFKMNQQDFGEARSLLARALAIFDKHPGDDPQYLALTLLSLGSIYEQQDKLTDAAAAYDRAVTEGAKVLPSDHPTLAWIEATQADFKMFSQQDVAGAVPILEKAIPVIASAEGANERYVAGLRADLASAYVSQQKYTDAERMYAEALPVLEKSMSKDDPTLKNALAGYEELKKYNAAQASGAAPKYGTRYVNGNMFQVATQGDLQVWMACWKGSELQAMLYVVNGSDHAITFFPEQIQLEAVKSGGRRSSLKTFSAEQYERKVTNANAFKAFAVAMGQSGANTPQSQTRNVSGQYEVQSDYGTSRRTYYGTITQWPSASDYAEAEARNRARTEAMLSQFSSSYQAISTSLMRTQTLDPHTYYGGVVYMNQSGKNYVMKVPFDGNAFQFSFTFK